MTRDCYGVCDFGSDGYGMYGPYTEAEARRRYPNDAVVRLVSGKLFACYPNGEKPEDDGGE